MLYEQGVPFQLAPINSPYRFFGDSTGNADEDFLPSKHPVYMGAHAYEDTWGFSTASSESDIALLSNGGWFEFRRHPVKEHYQLYLVTFLSDGEGVLGAHHAVVEAFVFEDGALRRDPAWNWGYPMLSIAPLDPQQISLDSIQQAGVDAHMRGGTFFEYFYFQKLPGTPP